jgi:hypothetical protein
MHCCKDEPTCLTISTGKSVVVVVVVVSFMKKWNRIGLFCMRGHCCHCYILKFCMCVHASSGGMQKLSKE